MSLEPENVWDAAARIIVTTVFFLWILYEGSVFESPYPSTLVQLYGLPLFRFVLVLLVFASTYWCPRVGAVVALAVFFYIEDMEKLRRPWVTLPTESTSTVER